MALIGYSCVKFLIYYLLLVSTKLMISLLLLKDILAHVKLQQKYIFTVKFSGKSA